MIRENPSAVRIPIEEVLPLAEQIASDTVENWKKARTKKHAFLRGRVLVFARQVYLDHPWTGAGTGFSLAYNIHLLPRDLMPGGRGPVLSTADHTTFVEKRWTEGGWKDFVEEGGRILVNVYVDIDTAPKATAAKNAVVEAILPILAHEITHHFDVHYRRGARKLLPLAVGPAEYARDWAERRARLAQFNAFLRTRKDMARLAKKLPVNTFAMESHEAFLESSAAATSVSPDFYRREFAFYPEREKRRFWLIAAKFWQQQNEG